MKIEINLRIKHNTVFFPGQLKSTGRKSQYKTQRKQTKLVTFEVYTLIRLFVNFFFNRNEIFEKTITDKSYFNDSLYIRKKTVNTFSLIQLKYSFTIGVVKYGFSFMSPIHSSDCKTSQK